MKKIIFLSLVLFAFIAISKSSVNAQGVKVGGFMQGWYTLTNKIQVPLR